ncbi:MAG: AAA family ATPase [Pseudomonadota bacterium]
MPRRILITGCSGAGKSTLCAALSERGHSVVPEPGLRIVHAEKTTGGAALPWLDMEAFLWRALKMSRDDIESARAVAGVVFHDRGLLDAAVGLRDHIGVPFRETLNDGFPYAQPVILAPPWHACFAQTEDRQHSFEDATREYRSILAALRELRCEVIELPFVDVATRVAWVERIVQEE